MKILLTLALVALSFSAFSQIGGKRIDTAYHCLDGRTIQPGDTLTLGSGALPNGDFKYITVMGQVDPLSLQSKYSGYHFTVKYFRLEGNKKMGYKTIAVIPITTFIYAGIDIEQAIKAGEVSF